MIRFFRQIRKTLMEQNKTRTYLIYAVGEIALVMIGILLALQVNNWNEERIEYEQEKLLIDNLNEEFSENLSILEKDILRLDSVIVGMEYLLQVMHDGPGSMTILEFEQLLASTFKTPNWIPSSFIMEEIKNSGGFSRLKNPQLKRYLFKWEREYISLTDTKDSYFEYASDYIDYLTEYGSVRNLDVINGSIPSLKRSTITTNDLSLLRNPQFENRTDNFYFLANSLRKAYIRAMENINNILEQTK